MATQQPEIVIEIDGDAVTVEVTGVAGPACRELSKPFTDLFAIATTRLKPEYHKAPAAGQKAAQPQ